MLRVREVTAEDEAAVAALVAATADRVAALDPTLRLARLPGSGGGLVAVDGGGGVHGFVRPVEEQLAPADDSRMYAPDRSVVWREPAADGAEAIAALADAIRATPVGAEADGLIWPAVDDVGTAWWRGIGLVHGGTYAVRPAAPLPGPLPSGVTARPASTADTGQVVALHREAVEFQAAASPYVRLFDAALEGFGTRLASGEATSTVLEAGGRLAAVAEWWTVDGGLNPPGRWVYLNSVAVAGSARGGGLGRAVVAAAIDAAGPGLAGSTLWFSPHNPLASRIWPHLGWRPRWSTWEKRSG